MTPTEAERIGRAWIAAGGPWLTRMRGVDRKGNGFTILMPHQSGDVLVHDDRVAAVLLPVRQAMLAQCWPDPRDAATVGCMLAVVREWYPDVPFELTYHPDADPGDGSGWTGARLPRRSTRTAAFCAVQEAWRRVHPQRRQKASLVKLKRIDLQLTHASLDPARRRVGWVGLDVLDPNNRRADHRERQREHYDNRPAGATE